MSLALPLPGSLIQQILIEHYYVLGTTYILGVQC